MLSQTRIGRYEVVSALGRGAMGAVYKAVDPLAERAVAVKAIRLDLSKEERAQFLERFYREASAGRLSHANIVTTYEVGETDEFAFIAMEYVEGESLRELLDSGAVLPIELIARIAARVADALNYAHENHVVHRDIKPANIMITPDRDVKIMDIGIAEIFTGAHTRLGALPGFLGSPKYMAPEQVAGGNTDGRTDVYALGVVLYEMLTGVTPFNGDNLNTIMDKVLKEEPVPPSTLNARVPPVFDRIVSRALAKRPRDRYQTALEFARDLRNSDAAGPQNARRPVATSTPAKAVQVREGTAIPSPAAGEGITEKVPSLPGKAQLRKALLLALPLSITAAFVMYPQGHQPRSDELAASRATPMVPATPTASAEPTVPAEPIPEPTVSATPMVPAAPRVAAKPRLSTKPRPSAKPRLAAKPAVLPEPGVPESASAPQPVSATLTLAISPWGEVYVDGKSVGVSPPLAALQLASGAHEVEIRNQEFVPHRDTVNLEPGKSLKIRHKFK